MDGQLAEAVAGEREQFGERVVEPIRDCGHLAPAGRTAARRRRLQQPSDSCAPRTRSTAKLGHALASPTTHTASPTSRSAVEQTLGFRMLSSERGRYETHLTRLERSGDWERGRTLSLEQATDFLRTIAAVPEITGPAH